MWHMHTGFKAAGHPACCTNCMPCSPSQEKVKWNPVEWMCHTLHIYPEL